MAERLVPFVDESEWDILRLAGTVTEKRKHIFLRILAETANLKLAAEASGYRTTAAINKLRKDDPAFDDAVVAASDAAADMIESEAVRRAVQGVKKEIYYKGEVVGYEFVYSDSLLQLLLKAAKPDKYAERKQTTVDMTGKVGIAVIPMAVRSLEEWERQALAVHEDQKKLTESEDGKVIEGQFTELKRA